MPTAFGASLERAPAEIGSDIVDQGAVLVGGGAKLRGIEQALRDATGLAIVGAEHPEHAVLRGVGRVLDGEDPKRAGHQRRIGPRSWTEE